MRYSRTILIVAALAGSLTCAAHAAAQRFASHASHAKSLLYVSDGTGILIYDATARNPRALGRLTKGLRNPAGLVVDLVGNLYVANEGGPNVVVFPPGATTPSATYSLDLYTPIDVAVGPRNYLYVANIIAAEQSSGNVVSYYIGNSNPVRIFNDPDFYQVDGVAVDPANNANNIFVSCYSSKGRGDVVEFAGGAQKGKNLRLQLISAGAMKVDSAGDLVVAVQRQYPKSGAIEVFAPGQRRPSQVFGEVGYPSAIAFNESRTLLYVADQANYMVEVYSYPAGKLVNFFAQGLIQPTGLAVGPGPA